MAKTLQGTVSSVAPNKTIVITIHSRKTHPLYKKQYTVSSKYMAHDENNDCKVGDKVTIVETRPLSARKRYTLQQIDQRAVLTQADKAAIDTSAEVDGAGATEASAEEIAS
jgi:small subunit ribosomal protein S17